MQQTYVNAFAHLRQFSGTAQFSAWLTRIAINEALARVRRRGRYEAFDDETTNAEQVMSANSAPNPERQAFAGELRDLLEGAIDALPNGLREVFVLREVEGLSTSETQPEHKTGAAQLAFGAGRQRTTPLRGLLQHPPYFHDGSAADLAAVVEHYNRHFALNLTSQQKADLIEYLKSL